MYKIILYTLLAIIVIVILLYVYLLAIITMSDHEENRQKLFTACKSGDKCLLIKSTKAGVVPSAYDMIDNQGKSPLHIACRYGHINIVRMLVEIYGCIPKMVDNTGSTPFHDACYYDQVLIVDYFIHTLSNPKEYLLAVDNNGNTPFHKANQSGSTHVINYILDTLLTGCTPEKLTLDMDFVFCSKKQKYEGNAYYFMLTNKVGDTPLAVACRHGHLSLIKIYMHCHDHLSQFSVNVPYLLKTASQCGQFEIVYYLQSNYCPVLSDTISEAKTNHEYIHLCRYCGGYHKVMHNNDQRLKDDIAFDVKHPKRWNIIPFSAGDSAVRSVSINMALLHNNEEYMNRFLALQEGSIFTTNNCLAASVADNVEFLKHRISSNKVFKLGNTLLYMACEWGSKNTVNYLITSKKCDLKSTNELGETPLHIACRYGQVEILRLFLNFNTSLCNKMCDKLSLSGETPLHLACLHVDSTTEIVNLILDNCQLSTIDSPDKYGDTPLMNSCRAGSIHLVERLVKMGCNPFSINNSTKETPVHIACRMQRLDIVKVLCKDFNGKVDHRNCFGETPLCLALNTSCLDIVEFIVNRGLCDVSLCLCANDSVSESVLQVKTMYCSPKLPLDYKNIIVGPCEHHEMLVRDQRMLSALQAKYSVTHTHQIPIREPTGDTALHFACKTNNLRLLQLLLNHCPASVTVTNYFGLTSLHIAAKNGSVSMLECLISSCKFPLDNFIDSNGNSVLHLACQRGILKVVKMLLESSSLTLQNKEGNTPIHVACYKKSAALVGCLLKKCSGNLDNHKNNESDTYLHIAATVGDLDTINLLLKHCSTTCQNANGDTPIHIACRANNQLVVECLLKNNTSTYPFKNKCGQTYLHVACNKTAKLNIVKTIFNMGYKILGNCPDNNGDIPLHYACRFGQMSIIEYLMADDRCDPYKCNNNHLSPMYHVLERKDLELIQCVIKKRLCDINQPIKSGSPWLHCLIQLTASERHYYDRRTYMQLVDDDEMLYRRHMMMDYQQNSSILLRKFLVIVDTRCNSILDLNATDSQGNTALHLACRLEQYEHVRELLSTDAVSQSLSHCNHNNKRPIQLTRDYGIIRLLISYGANPEDVYDRFASILEKSKEEQPLEPAVKVIVLGNATAGKTTLVAVLKSNDKDVLQVKGSTAGIETSKYNSKKFGRVTFHDFAGQPEYESSHSAFLERCSSSMQPPLFLLVVNASQCQHIDRRIHNWLSFIQNHCTCSTNTPPHVIVIGSHVDKVKELSHTKDVFVKAIDNFKSSDFECFEPVFLDCRKVDTEGMKTLLSRLEKSCLSLKQFVELDCRCHILFAHLLKWFSTNPVVKVKDLLRRIKQRKSVSVDYQRKRMRLDRPIPYNNDLFDDDCAEESSEFLLPISTEPLIDLLKSLHTGGHILLLEVEALEESWIVLDQDALFKSVNGILFAPKDFKDHLELENNTGVVPLSKLQTLFPGLDFGMVKQFLIHYEFCHKIEDNETLKLIHGSNELIKEVRSCSHTYYFFPGFVQSEKPMNIWDTPEESPYSFSCGWMLQCQSKQFFETRFLHVLLLRLTFTFVSCTSTEASVLKRQCNIWKNGIHWSTRKGVEVMVELVEDKTMITVLVRCLEGQELEAVKLRTAVLKKIWETKLEFCLKVNTDEYLIHPSRLTNTYLQDQKLYSISIKEIAQTVIEASPCVICPSDNKPMPLDKLLYYEPYSRMDEEHVRLLFSKENANTNIPTETMYSLSTFLHPFYQCLIKVLRIPEAELGFHRDKWRDHPVKLLHHLFESWTSRREKPTFQTLRSEFDEYSIFFGRDPQV